jgi:hypothetical protein
MAMVPALLTEEPPDPLLPVPSVESSSSPAEQAINAKTATTKAEPLREYLIVDSPGRPDRGPNRAQVASQLIKWESARYRVILLWRRSFAG